MLHGRIDGVLREPTQSLYRPMRQLDLIGHVENIAALYSSSDLLILPSYYEGLPNALIEAINMGCRVLTVALPTVKELVDELELSECLVDAARFGEDLTLGVEQVM